MAESVDETAKTGTAWWWLDRGGSAGAASLGLELRRSDNMATAADGLAAITELFWLIKIWSLW